MLLVAKSNCGVLQFPGIIPCRATRPWLRHVPETKDLSAPPGPGWLSYMSSQSRRSCILQPRPPAHSFEPKHSMFQFSVALALAWVTAKTSFRYPQDTHGSKILGCATTKKENRKKVRLSSQGCEVLLIKDTVYTPGPVERDWIGLYRLLEELNEVCTREKLVCKSRAFWWLTFSEERITDEHSYAESHIGQVDGCCRFKVIDGTVQIHRFWTSGQGLGCTFHWRFVHHQKKTDVLTSLFVSFVCQD